MTYRREVVCYPSQPEQGFSKAAARQEPKSYARHFSELLGSREQFLESNRRMNSECRTGRH